MLSNVLKLREKKVHALPGEGRRKKSELYKKSGGNSV